MQTRGLVDTGAGEGTQPNPATLYLQSTAPATQTNELNKTSSVTTDRFGFVLTQTNELGYHTEYQRDANGRVTQITTPDPDGVGGPLAAAVTQFQYDTNGNLTRITSADNSTRTWVYDTTPNLPTSFTDELNRTTSFTYESGTGYEYNGRGQVTLPDPDGAGPRTAPITH